MSIPQRAKKYLYLALVSGLFFFTNGIALKAVEKSCPAGLAFLTPCLSFATVLPGLLEFFSIPLILTALSGMIFIDLRGKKISNWDWLVYVEFFLVALCVLVFSYYYVSSRTPQV